MKRTPALTKNEIRPKTLPISDWSTPFGDGVEHRDRVGHRVGDLLDRGRARLLQVVGADVDRVPAGHVDDRVGDRVGDQAHRRTRGEGVGAAAEVLLEDVVLGRALQRLGGDRRVLALGGDDVERQQPRRGGVDRHRRVHLIERDRVDQRAHVADVGHRHADLADLAASELVVGVIAGLGREVERDRQAGLALPEVAAVQLVGAARVGVAGVGPDHPGPITLGQARRGRIKIAATRLWFAISYLAHRVIVRKITIAVHQGTAGLRVPPAHLRQ